MRSLVLFSAVAACSAPTTAEVASAISDTPFVIHALGNRCIGLGPRTKSGTSLVIQKCNGSPKQEFFTSELSGHDIQLIPATLPSQCAGVVGAIAPGSPLGLTQCSGTVGQRFAFDGDALLVGQQSDKSTPITRDFAIEYLDSNTNEGTPVVVGTRDLDDAEYWQFVSVGKADARPHSGFVTVTTEVELAFDLIDATWGQVLELDPPDGATVISLDGFPFATITVPGGVTLRGGRKFMSNGVLLDVPDDRHLEEKGFLLKLADYSRVTQLRLEGIPYQDDDHMMVGLDVGTESAEASAPDPTHVIIDHIELSHWSLAGISTWGPYTSPYNELACPKEKLSDEPDEQLVGNFLHDNAYGIGVAQGAFAFVRGNLMYRANHHVTSSFYNGFNRYVAFDNLFDDHENDKNTVFDVHGACTPGHWGGGRAGDFFEAAFNSFLTTRHPMVDVRGTPCDHFSFHDNVSIIKGTSETLAVETAIQDPGEDPACDSFVPGNPADILQVSASNSFEIENPLYKKLAVGDFDGDGRDDVFFATGATWWFSSGGKAEWRLLNRMPQRTSDLIFGDFDADGRTDVVAMIDQRLMVSWAGASRWFPLTTTLPNMTIADIAVGQFDSDPRADLFFGDGSTWFWAPAGGAWQQFGISNYRVADLGFGDFTGDGLTDIFNSANGTWKIVTGVWQPWQDLGPAQFVDDTQRLVVADFDGDGIADVGANVDNGVFKTWMMSSGGTNASVTFAIDDQQMVDLPIGRFDDTKGADVLRWDNDLWFWLNSPFADELWSRQFMR